MGNRMRKMFLLLIFLFMISPLERAFCYSILEEGDEKIEKNMPRKDPGWTLVSNVSIPPALFLIGNLIVPLVSEYRDIEWNLEFTLLIGAPYAFTFSTIPAHIYVHTPAGKVILLFSGKLIAATVIPIMLVAGISCAGCGDVGCACPSKDTVTSSIIAGWSITFGIYIYEIIDTYRAAVKYNEKLEKEKQNSQSSFFIQPIITPNGDIFLAGGIRF
jgi:hypothetical protein